MDEAVEAVTTLREIPFGDSVDATEIACKADECVELIQRTSRNGHESCEVFVCSPAVAFGNVRRDGQRGSHRLAGEFPVSRMVSSERSANVTRQGISLLPNKQLPVREFAHRAILSGHPGHSLSLCSFVRLSFLPFVLLLR